MKSKIANPLIDNGKQFVELGNLTWTLHDCWLYYKMSMDETILRELIYPVLRRSINYYLHFIKKEEGKYHLPPTDSPEYGELCEDCNYDLSLLKWGCQTLLECVERLNIQDEKQEIWEDICLNLTDYPVDETGYMIGKNLPYAKTHRHFSHLMMHIPLYLVNRDNSDTWELVEKSIRHWFSYEGDILGFSFVGASLLCSAYKKGDLAVEHFYSLLNQRITVNTMYQEEGPVIETPLAGAECIHQLLLQSWGGKIRVFPSLPSHWEEAAFSELAAQGGFRVSASFAGGKTQWIEIRSIAGEKCVVETDMQFAELVYEDDRTEKIKIDGCAEISLKAGEKVRIIRHKS